MKFWDVEKANNVYTFTAKDKKLCDTGIHYIKIYIKPEYHYSEIHAKATQQETYVSILSAGKLHAFEKYSAISESKQKNYYFDSQHDSFEGKTDSWVCIILSNKSWMTQYLISTLAHIEPFEDMVSCAMNLEESLTVLAEADKNVEEIIDFMQGKIAVQPLKDKCLHLITKNPAFSLTATDKRHNLKVLPNDLLTFFQSKQAKQQKTLQTKTEDVSQTVQNNNNNM